MKTQIQHAKVWAIALTIAGMTVTAAAQQPAGQAPPAPPAGGAAQAPPQTLDRYIVGQAQPPVEPGASIREMTLEQAIDIALENNLDLKVAKMNPQIQDYSLQAARATFKPVLSGNFSNNHASTLSTNTLDAVSTNRITQAQTYGTTLSQNLLVLGRELLGQLQHRAQQRQQRKRHSTGQLFRRHSSELQPADAG